jgi:CBS domain containing-hemolysin-like protein
VERDIAPRRYCGRCGVPAAGRAGPGPSRVPGATVAATGDRRRDRPARRDDHPIDLAFGLLAVVLLIAFNGVFVAAEFALVAADRSKIERAMVAGSRRARIADGLLRTLSFQLSGAQFGITVTSLILGFLAQPVVAQLIEPLIEPLVGERAVAGVALVVALALTTTVQMVVGELVPKSLAIARPEATTLRLAPVVRVYGIVAGPVLRLLNGAANGIVRALGVEPQEELSNVRSPTELLVMVETSTEQGTLPDSASALLTRSIRFGSKTADDALIPRVDVVALPVDATVVDLVSLSVESGHSRFPIYGADLDDVRGIVHVRRAHNVPRDRRTSVAVGDLMVPALGVPESRELDDVLVDLRRARTHMAVVVDEYGGTAGILTLEDVLEEIVGEIGDEHDRPPELTRARRRGEFVVDGTQHLDEVLDLCGLELPEGEYETIAGFVLDRLGHIPTEGEGVEEGEWRIEVVTMDRRRIAEVRLAPRNGDDGERTWS